MNRRRRSLIAAGLASVMPSALHAAAPAGRKHSVGVLRGGRLEDTTDDFDALRTTLAQHGYVEGQNLAFDLRFADYRYERLPTLAADLVAKRVDILITAGTPATIAAHKATSRIPIIDVKVVG